MTSFTVFFISICVVVTCCALPVQKILEPVDTTGVKEAEHRVLEELEVVDARNKRDTYEYSYSSSSKSESSVSWSMKRTGSGNGNFIIIGAGDHNQNYVKIG